MSNLLDIVALVINVLSIFASVSFAASAATGAIVDLLKLRARGLQRGLQGLLFDPAFTGLALELYKSAKISPIGYGSIQSKADVKLDTPAISSETFAEAILEVLHVVPASNSPGDKNIYRDLDTPDLAEEDRIANAIFNAKLVIDKLVGEGLRPHAAQLIEDLITLGKAERGAMATAAAAWFNAGMTQVADQFSRRVRFSNFLVAVLIAAILNLQPIPLGGFDTFANNKPGAPSSTALAGDLPYVVASFQWLIVGLSALPGSQFWHELLNMLISQYSQYRKQ
jgi:hypothetical protein